MADKMYLAGIRGFKKHDNAPDFVLGSGVINLKGLKEFLNSKEVEPYFTDYKGEKQLPFKVLRAKDGSLSFEVDTYKKGDKKETSDDLPF